MEAIEAATEAAVERIGCVELMIEAARHSTAQSLTRVIAEALHCRRHGDTPGLMWARIDRRLRDTATVINIHSAHLMTPQALELLPPLVRAGADVVLKQEGIR